MRKIGVLFLLVLATPMLWAQNDPEAKRILDEMSARYQKTPNYTANFAYKLENTQENISEKFEGKVTVKGDMFYLKLGSQEIYNNGETVWTYFTDINEVNIDNFVPGASDFTPTKIYTMYKEGYKYRRLEGKTVNGDPHYVVDIEPEQPKDMIYKVRLFIKKSDYTVTSWAMFDKAGNKFIYEVENFKPTTVADDLFTFNPSKHQGIEVVDLR